MTIAVVKERGAHERRVAVSPETVKKLVAMGCVVRIEAGAGEGASFTDHLFAEAGGTIVDDAAQACKGAQIVLAVQTPDIEILPKGALLIGMLAPYQNTDRIQALAAQGVDAFSMELVPRITRAQAMDVLSSQSNLAGYKSVLDAAEHFTRAFPMMMTAAGTIPPARVFVMGAGVAGLQAIATARRLGAIVSATDVRLAAKEQVQSLGATFVMVEDEETRQAETSGGYAKEMSEAYKAKQAALIEETIRKQDIVITTALIPGRPAPKLVTEAMVKSMKPGSVIVDLAVEQGGNCVLSKPGKTVEVGGVKIIGHRNVPGRLATDASALYAKNLLNFLGLVVDKKTGDLAINWDDEIIKAVTLTRGGVAVHPQFGGASPEKSDEKTSEKSEKSEKKAAS
ncbi:MAG: Re/Si-specific NAD(P)(+) transhydrogenase subunit alpha [Rhodospirillales bacterium]|nr:Re/Si-specific NAD(P)(+) transhydrogenase subunit alpha [Rhodospirillales bacterium]